MDDFMLLNIQGSTFDRAGAGLKATMMRLNHVMATPQRRVIGYMVMFSVLLFFIYKLWPSRSQ
jgi:hypothetical protein